MSTHSAQDEKSPEQYQDEAAQTAAGNENGTDGADEPADLPDGPTKDGETDTKSLNDRQEDVAPNETHSDLLSDSIPPDENLYEAGEEMPYPEPTSTLFHPPDFRPLFTLIEDPTTDTHHHPTVHYLFSDDDPDILTAAALETLSDEHHDEIEERFVVVDMSADGKEIVGTSSFSPEWQALRTRVTQAPSWGDQTRAADRGLMLRIEGREAGSGSRVRKKGDVEAMLGAFDEAMGGLDEALGGITGQEQSRQASR